MSALNATATSVCDWLLTTSWHVALLILVVFAVQVTCGRWLRPSWRYSLWLLVVLRLVLPAVPESSIGLLQGSPPVALFLPLSEALAVIGEEDEQAPFHQPHLGGSSQNLFDRTVHH